MKANTSTMCTCGTFAVLLLSCSSSSAQERSPALLGCSPPPALDWGIDAQPVGAAARPSWSWYRVVVTSVGENKYHDFISKVVIVTRLCTEAAAGMPALLQWNEETEGSWMTFDNGKTCDAVDLILEPPRKVALITGMRNTTALVSADLVGMPSAEVQAALGPPRQIDGARWTYQNNDVTFYLYVSCDTVGSVRPEDAPLETLRVPNR